LCLVVEVPHKLGAIHAVRHTVRTAERPMACSKHNVGVGADIGLLLMLPAVQGGRVLLVCRDLVWLCLLAYRLAYPTVLVSFWQRLCSSTVPSQGPKTRLLPRVIIRAIRSSRR
jgi:hypothetical protein